MIGEGGNVDIPGYRFDGAGSARAVTRVFDRRAGGFELFQHLGIGRGVGRYLEFGNLLGNWQHGIGNGSDDGIGNRADLLSNFLMGFLNGGARRVPGGGCDCPVVTGTGPQRGRSDENGP